MITMILVKTNLKPKTVISKIPKLLSDSRSRNRNWFSYETQVTVSTLWLVNSTLVSWCTVMHVPGRNMICRPKQIQASLNLMELSVGAGIEIPIEMKFGNQSKQIRFNISPNLMVWVSHPPAFLDVSRHFVKKKSPRNPSRSEFRCMGELIYQKTPLSSTYHWFEAHWKFRITVRGVAAAVSLFGDDLYCICFDHPNRETAMLSMPCRWRRHCWDF